MAGSKLKETGNNHWISPNTSATNESGFTGIPGGVRLDNGSFSGIGMYGYWWSSTQDLSFPDYTAWYRNLYYNYSDIGRFTAFETLGMSVRCIKN